MPNLPAATRRFEVDLPVDLAQRLEEHLRDRDHPDSTISTGDISRYLVTLVREHLTRDDAPGESR